MISVVFPCFNEEQRIVSTLERSIAFLGARGEDWEIVVVDDGSADGTSGSVRRRFGQDPRVRILREESNHGKGWAVRAGVLAARAPLVLFSDADLSTPIHELDRFVARALAGFDLVIASRIAPGATIPTPQPWRRRLSGWVFRNLVQVLGLSTFGDTQCGFKLLRVETMRPVLERMETVGFAFDVELIARAERAGLRVTEEPVEWHDAAGSKVRLLSDSLRMVGELLRIRRILRASV